MNVVIRGKQVRLDPSMSIGKGGEADVFAVGNKAIKIFKPPNHPDLKGFPDEQTAAKLRIAEHQQKLPAFPKNLPTKVITPQELVYDKSGKIIIGYIMELVQNAEILLRYAEKSFRQAGVSNEMITRIFQSLYQTVIGTHKAGVILSDFNDLNVLVKNTDAYVIDADSSQFGKFLCHMFTTRFVDPLLCDKSKKSLMLSKPYTMDSDWYAFSVMLMQCLLFVGPYGGIYKPKIKSKLIPHDARPLHRITVFNPEVRYPKPAIPYEILPDELLHYFHLVFEKDRRGEFPTNLLTDLHWQTCPSCGQDYARNLCPFCVQVAPAAIKEVITIRGRVTANRIFKTKGVILFSCYQDGLKWIYHENVKFKRENQSIIIEGDRDPQLRFRIQGEKTLIGKKNKLLTIDPITSKTTSLTVDSYGLLPIFAANHDKRFWITSGNLMADGKLGPDFPEQIGEVLTNQTLFWVGPKFGFGFYRAGNLNVAFVFDCNRRSIKDTVKLPLMAGQLVGATCVFTKEKCWLLLSFQEKGKIINQCSVISSNGLVESTTTAVKGDGSWLSSIHGKCAAGNYIFSPTDDGISRVEQQGSTLVETQKFPDTEPFVTSVSKLFPSKDGLYVVNSQDVTLLKIK